MSRLKLRHVGIAFGYVALAADPKWTVERKNFN
jgi:hypothetical protein